MDTISPIRMGEPHGSPLIQQSGLSAGDLSDSSPATSSLVFYHFFGMSVNLWAFLLQLTCYCRRDVRLPVREMSMMEGTEYNADV